MLDFVIDFKFYIHQTLGLNMNVPFTMTTLNNNHITINLTNNFFACAPEIFHRISLL